MPVNENRQAAQVNVPVAFGGVSFGDKTARIGVDVSREGFELRDADEYFCDRRLTGEIVLGGAGDDAGQLSLIPDGAHRIPGVFDVKGFRASAKKISIGLTFGVGEIDRGELARFAKAEGRLLIFQSQDIPDGEGNEDDTPLLEGELLNETTSDVVVG